MRPTKPKCGKGCSVKSTCSLILLAAMEIFASMSALAWGTGHGTVARETLKHLPGEWGERMRGGEGGKMFLSSSHAPDDQSTLLTDRADYVDGTLVARLTSRSGKTPVMYRFHSADARCELVLAMSRAMRSGNEKALGFLLGCFNHSVADTVAANHSPLIQLAIYNWKALGLPDDVEDDCVMLDKSPERKAVLSRVATAACANISSKDLVPQAVFDAAYADQLAGPDFYCLDRDFCAGGDAAVNAFAQEAAYAVRRTVEAFLAAESFSRLPEDPVFDKALTEQRYRDMAMRRLSARSMKDDAITTGVLPGPGRTPSIGVLYDATGFWISGIVGMVNRTLSVQIAATLGKRHDAALLDMRDMLTNGVPSGVDVVVAPCSGLRDNFGFSHKALVSALKQFVDRGGRLVWVGGSPKPPRELFPESVAFAENPVRGRYGCVRCPVSTDEMPGGTLVTPSGRFRCVREPRGKAGWYWDQIGLAFLPADPLPEGCRELVRFEAKDGRRIVVGYVKGRCAFVPAFSVFPYLFTDTCPSVRPLVLELDAAGEAVMESALNEID